MRWYSKYHFFLKSMQVNTCRKENDMVWFVVTTFFDKEKEKEGYSEYIKEVKPIVNKYHGRYIVRSENIKPLSSEWKPDRVIIIEFDTKEQLEKCFSSEEYLKIATLRENSVDSRAIIIE